MKLDYDENLYDESYIEETNDNAENEFVLNLMLVKEKAAGLKAIDVMKRGYAYFSKVSNYKKSKLKQILEVPNRKILRLAKKLAKHGYALSQNVCFVRNSPFTIDIVSFKSLVNGNYDDSIYNVYLIMLKHHKNYEAVQFYKKSKSHCLDNYYQFDVHTLQR